MTDEELLELRHRLVIGRKADGRCVYDERAKAELVAVCRLSGRSVSRLARDCGVNANQLSRWLRLDDERRGAIAADGEPQPAFVPVTIGAMPRLTTPTMPTVTALPTTAAMSLQARLPNGVVVDLRHCEASQLGQVLGYLGGLKCSASTSG